MPHTNIPRSGVAVEYALRGTFMRGTEIQNNAFRGIFMFGALNVD